MFGRGPISSAPFAGSGNKTVPQMLLVAVTTTVSLLKSVLKTLSVSVGASVTLAFIAAYLRTLLVSVTGAVSIVKFISLTFTILSTAVATLLVLPNKLLTASVTATVSYIRAIGKNLDIVSQYVVIVLTNSATHLVGFALTVVGAASFTRAITQVYSVLVNSVANIYFGWFKTLTTSVTSSVRIGFDIALQMLVSVTGAVSIVTAFFFYKTLDVVVTSTAEIYKAFGKVLSTVVTGTATLVRSTGKVLSVVVTAVARLYPEFVKIFGAVAKFTFIVRSRKDSINVVKNRSQIVAKGKK